jgi:hypothetical protein
MVVATGAATATKFLSKPLSIHFHPPLLRFLSVWGRLRASSLNISLRITSAGFVRIAPHNPAARDFWADWRACSERCDVMRGDANERNESRNCFCRVRIIALEWSGWTLVVQVSDYAHFEIARSFSRCNFFFSPPLLKTPPFSSFIAFCISPI